MLRWPFQKFPCVLFFNYLISICSDKPVSIVKKYSPNLLRNVQVMPSKQARLFCKVDKILFYLETLTLVYLSANIGGLTLSLAFD